MKVINIFWGIAVITALAINIYFSSEQNKLIADNLYLLNEHLEGEIALNADSLENIKIKLSDLKLDINDVRVIVESNSAELQNTSLLSNTQKSISNLERNILDLGVKLVAVEERLGVIEADMELMTLKILEQEN